MTDIARRTFLRVVFSGAAVAGATAACKSKSSYYVVANKGIVCSDTTGLAADAVAARTQHGYVEHADKPSENCGNCQNFKPGTPNNCGSCTVLKGTINPDGHCSSWARKAT